MIPFCRSACCQRTILDEKPGRFGRIRFRRWLAAWYKKRNSYYSFCNKPEMKRGSPSTLNKLSCLLKRFVQFAGVLAAATRVVGFAAAFAAHDRGDLLDQFAGLDF